MSSLGEGSDQDKVVENNDIVKQETEKGVSDNNKDSKQVDIVTSLLPNEKIDDDESSLTEEGRLATDEEIHTYRNVSQNIPWSVCLLQLSNWQKDLPTMDYRRLFKIAWRTVPMTVLEECWL